MRVRLTILAILLTILTIGTLSVTAQTFCVTGPAEDENGVSLGADYQICVTLLGTLTPTPTDIVVLLPTETATSNPPPPTRTATPTDIPIPTATATEVPVPPTATATPFPTSTATAAPTPTGLIVGPGGAYSTISAAITAAAVGDTIRVKAGTYSETATITKRLTLTAYGDGTPWVTGACTRANGIIVQAHDVVVSGMGVKQTTSAGIYINGNAINPGPARTIVSGNTIQDYNCGNAGAQNAAGISAWYAGPTQQITNNTITRRVEISQPQAGQGNGIWFKSNTSRPSGGGHTISWNTITGGYDGIGGEDEFDVRGGFDRDTTIANNTISNCGDDGIQVEGGGLNVIVQDNVINQCGIGIALATPLTGPVTVQRNTITSSVLGSLGALMCYKVGNTASGVSILIDQNACDADGSAFGANQGKGIQQTNTWGPGAIFTVTANTWNVTAYVFEFEGVPGPGSTLNNDCMYTTDPNRFAKWGGTPYNTLAGFRNATGQELQGVLGPC